MKTAAELTSDAVLYALAASLAFLLAVVIVDPQLRKSPIGQSLIVLDTGLAALYVPSVLQRFAGVHLASAWFAWYVLATVLVIGTATWWRTIIMVRAQWKGRAAPPRKPRRGRRP